MTDIQRNLEGDRISKLPGNVTDHILEFLPTRDAARTCALSTGWRYVWANHRSLVLDSEFWVDIKQRKLSSEVTIDYVGIVNRILLHHIGNIEKFVVDIPAISSQHHCDFDLWLTLVCRRGVKVLTLINPAPDAYKIPSCVFSAPKLMEMFFFKCTMKAIGTPASFSWLQNLNLIHVSFDSCALITPLLTSLALKNCLGMRGFSISAPKLESLILNANDNINLIPYIICSNISYVFIFQNINIEDHRDTENVYLLQIFSCWPKLQNLSLNGSSLKYLRTRIVLENVSVVLNLKHFVTKYIKLDQIVSVLHILRNSPLMQTFEISLSTGHATNELKVLKYLERPSIMNLRMEQLRTVKLQYFKGSNCELQFVKILLHCVSSLKLLIVDENAAHNSDEKLKISKELLRFPSASPEAEIIFGLL